MHDKARIGLQACTSRTAAPCACHGCQHVHGATEACEGARLGCIGCAMQASSTVCRCHRRWQASHAGRRQVNTCRHILSSSSHPPSFLNQLHTCMCHCATCVMNTTVVQSTSALVSCYSQLWCMCTRVRVPCRSMQCAGVWLAGLGPWDSTPTGRC